MSWDWWHNLAEVVRDLGIGIGTFIGGYGARPVIKRWRRKEKQKEQYHDKYMQRFSSHLRDRDSSMIWKLKNSNKIFAIYKPNNTRQHIKTWATYKELGYESGDWDKEVDRKELGAYQEDEPIDFI